MVKKNFCLSDPKSRNIRTPVPIPPLIHLHVQPFLRILSHPSLSSPFFCHLPHTSFHPHRGNIPRHITSEKSNFSPPPPPPPPPQPIWVPIMTEIVPGSPTGNDAENNHKSPLLGSPSRRLSGGGESSGKRPRLSRGNSLSSLRSDFVARLPDKVRSGIEVESSGDIDFNKTTSCTKGEKEYYEKQFATLKSFDEVDHLMDPDSIIEDDEERKQQEFAMKISNIANVVLLLFKIYATIRSGSIAIAASTLDSLLDLMAGGILWFTHLSMKNINIYKYPIGKLRVQPVGIIIFAAIMATLGFQILIQAVEELIRDESTDEMSASQLIWLTAIMIGASIVKLGLFLYCRTSRNDIVRAYAKDHYFDVITNIVGLVAAILGDKFYWWIDPAGAIVLAVYTMTNWSGTVLENAGIKSQEMVEGEAFGAMPGMLTLLFVLFKLFPCYIVTLIGQSAPPEVLQKLTYLVLRHPQIKRVDTVRAYTFGVLYFVEVDIELPEEIPLKEAHHIGETLQDKIEKLPEVERAFVHLDYECEHKPEHTILSQLPNTDP
ncbi:Metal tolerance protein 4-like protein [Drosera capensis]